MCKLTKWQTKNLNIPTGIANTAKLLKVVQILNIIKQSQQFIVLLVQQQKRRGR